MSSHPGAGIQGREASSLPPPPSTLCILSADFPDVYSAMSTDDKDMGVYGMYVIRWALVLTLPLLHSSPFVA